MKVYLELYKDRVTRSYQLSIGNSNGGYRIAGTKFSGNSMCLQKHELTERDAEEIRRYLNMAYPEGAK